MSKRRLAINSLSGVAAFLTNIVVSFIMTPVIVHAIGNRNYGVWELLVGLVGYLGLLEFGIGPALVRYIADARARNDVAETQTIFSTGLLALTGAGLLGLLGFGLVSIWPEHILRLEPGDSEWITPVLVVFGLNLAVGLPRVAISAYVLGLQAYGVVKSIQIVSAVVQAVIVYRLLSQGVEHPLIWMGAVMFGGSIAQALAMIAWIRFVDRGVKLTVVGTNFARMRELIGYGVKNTVLGISEGTSKKLANFAIAYTSGLSKVVYFAVPARLVDYAQTLSMELSLPLIPYFADIVGKGDRHAMREAWVQTTRLFQVVAFGMAVATAGFGEPFIRLWMGGEYADRGAAVLYILSATLFAQGIASNGIRILMSMARHGGIALFSVILAALCFGLSVLLGHWWGIEGVAVGVLVYGLCISIAEVVLVCRILEVRLGHHIAVNILPFALPILAGGAVIVGLHEMTYPRSYLELMWQGVLAGGIYLAVVWFFVLHVGERASLKSLLRVAR